MAGSLNEPVTQRATLTVAEVAVVLGISRSMAYEMVQTGDLPALRFGRRIVVPRRALEKLMATVERT